MVYPGDAPQDLISQAFSLHSKLEKLTEPEGLTHHNLGHRPKKKRQPWDNHYHNFMFISPSEQRKGIHS